MQDAISALKVQDYHFNLTLAEAIMRDLILDKGDVVYDTGACPLPKAHVSHSGVWRAVDYWTS